MQVSRRSFGKFLSSAGLAIATGFTTMAVSCGSVFNEILQYVPVALQALQGLLSVLQSGGITLSSVVQADLNDAKAAFADLQADVTSYNDAPAASKATLLGQVSTALSIVQGSVQKFWTDLGLPDGNIATIVSGVLGVILSTLAYYQAQLPATSSIPVHNPYKPLPFTAQKRTPKQMRADINKILAPAGVQIY